MCLWISSAVFNVLTTHAAIPVEPWPGEMQSPPPPVHQLGDHYVYQKIGELLRVRLTFPAYFKLFVCFGVC